MRLRLSDAESIVAGALAGSSGDVVATGLTVDSREIREGFLFAALKGSFLDGHDYVNHAFDKGASAAIIERDIPDAKGPTLRVRNTMDAVTLLASFNRDSLDPLVIGITGSTGKTSTRDLLSSIVSRKFKTVTSERNFNNEIGVPLTLLRISQETEVVICELGSRGPGHIRDLCEIARPQVGIVTNIGLTHYEQFGSREGIAEAKAELIRALPEGGTAVLNSDDPLVMAMREYSEANVITFGESSKQVSISNVQVDSFGRPRFRLGYEDQKVGVELDISGIHQVGNAAAAAAAALALGFDLGECKAGLQSAHISPWRMEVAEVGGVMFVNDAYNSSPASCNAALETCSFMRRSRSRLIAILGYMAELGDIEEAEHLALGKKCASLVDWLIVVGDKARGIADGARKESLGIVDRVKDGDDAVALLTSSSDRLANGDVVLVKGSRVAGLETVVDSLRETMAGA